MEKKTGMPEERPISPQLWIGVIVIAVGVLLLAQQLLGLNLSGITRFIPLLFVLLGVWQLIANRFRFWLGPVILIGVAGAAQLGTLNLLDWSSLWQFWPLLLILIGGSVLLRQWRGPEQDVVPAEGGEQFQAFALFGGTGKRITSQALRGGEITALFGGVEVDLSDAHVVDPPAVIQVFAMFGGAGLKASADTLIDLRVTAVFGGAADERRQRKALAGEAPALIVRGFVMFGGVSIEEARRP